MDSSKFITSPSWTSLEIWVITNAILPSSNSSAPFAISIFLLPFFAFSVLGVPLPSYGVVFRFVQLFLVFVVSTIRDPLFSPISLYSLKMVRGRMFFAFSLIFDFSLSNLFSKLFNLDQRIRGPPSLLTHLLSSI